MKCFSALIWLGVLCLPFAFKNYTIAQDLVGVETLNNFEVLLSLSNGLVEKAIVKSSLPKDSVNILLTTAKQNSNNWFIEKRLWSYLKDTGFQVYSTSVDSLQSNQNRKGTKARN